MTIEQLLDQKHIESVWKLHGKSFNRNYGTFYEAKRDNFSIFHCGVLCAKKLTLEWYGRELSKRL